MPCCSLIIRNSEDVSWCLYVGEYSFIYLEYILQIWKRNATHCTHGINPYVCAYIQWCIMTTQASVPVFLCGHMYVSGPQRSEIHYTILHLTGDIVKIVFLNGNCYILIPMSVKIVQKGWIDIKFWFRWRLDRQATSHYSNQRSLCLVQNIYVIETAFTLLLVHTCLKSPFSYPVIGVGCSDTNI